MLIVTSETIENKRIVEVLGLVQGAFARDSTLGDMTGLFSNLLKSEEKGASKILANCREEALRILTQQAKDLGANAVIGLRFSTTMIRRDRPEVLVYGTAIVVE